MNEITVAACVDINAALKEIKHEHIIDYIKDNDLKKVYRDALDFKSDIEDFSSEQLLEELEQRGDLPESEEPELKAENLLEVQLFEAFQECLKNVNQIQLLELLENISRNGLKAA